MQFMICIDKGCAKKKRKNNQLKKKMTKCITRVVLLVTLSVICPFFHENHGVFIHEESYREKAICLERIIS